MKHAILFCIEKGFLEFQTKLLIDSFNQFADNKDITLFAFSPREKFQPCESSKKFLANNNVNYIDKILNTDFIDYPIANKILCCAYFENEYKEYESILFVDTDTVFLNQLNLGGFKDKGIYLKPVGHKGPGTNGIGDDNDPFWQNIFALFRLPVSPVNVKTTIAGEPIRGYYNAGFVWSLRIDGFFTQWHNDFLTLIESEIRPPNFISKDGNNFRCLDQVALAVTVSRHVVNINILPQSFNHHIPFRPMMTQNNWVSLDKMVHVHYHKWFHHPEFLDHIVSESEKSCEQYLWLKSQLPIEPVINDSFKC